MQIIAELAPWDNWRLGPSVADIVYPTGREGTTHGPYAGCVGCFSFNGNLDTCITIRTALCSSPQPSPGLCGHPLPLPQARDNVQTGGGWVNDSEPEAEFQETVNQSKVDFPHNPHPVSPCVTTLSRSRGRGTVAQAETFANA